eukprot:GILJ01002407.1.p1 GENE.GILJ01002407.1~~GILJ01002407.1.p1  ORF type:complete len:150 (+),score=19.11 GILJ01002407.1:48-497(+)
MAHAVVRYDRKVHLSSIQSIERKTFPKSESMWESIDSEARKPHCTLLVVEGEDRAVIGYILFATQRQEGAKILKLAVRADRRHQGVATALLESAICLLRVAKMSVVSLHVDVQRDHAVALYTKFGFLIDRQIPAYYGPDRDAHFMCLSL